MTELTFNLRKQLSDFQNICSKFNDNERNNKELNSMLQHLQHSNAILNENDKKSNEQIKILRQTNNEQVKIIAELHDFKKRNEILIEDNASLQNLVQTLKDKIDSIEIKNEETIQSYNLKHKLEIDDKEDEFSKRERILQDKIDELQVSYNLELFENENEKKNLKISFDEQLKKANNKEQQLTTEIFKVNNQLSSSTALLQKKIHELEEKLKTLEREKSLFKVSQGNFINASNVIRNYPNVNQIMRNNSNNNSVNQTQNKNCVTRNVDINTDKKFQFRKSNRSSNVNVDQRLLSESFDPFEMNKQMNANNQPRKQNDNSTRQMNTTNSSNHDVIYDINEDNFESRINSFQEYKLEENKNSEISLIDDKNSEATIADYNQKDKIKPLSSPSVKKRKLFNPNNMEYLN